MTEEFDYRTRLFEIGEEYGAKIEALTTEWLARTLKMPRKHFDYGERLLEIGREYGERIEALKADRIKALKPYETAKATAVKKINDAFSTATETIRRRAANKRSNAEKAYVEDSYQAKSTYLGVEEEHSDEQEQRGT